MCLQPKASCNEIIGIHNNQLKIRLTAPPIDGKAILPCANSSPRHFAVAHSQVELISGAQNREKRLLIHSPKQLITGIKSPN